LVARQGQIGQLLFVVVAQLAQIGKQDGRRLQRDRHSRPESQ
jgi:hypothetical protein